MLPCSNIKIKSINEYLLNSHFQYYFAICSDNFSLFNPTRKWTLFLNPKQEEKTIYRLGRLGKMIFKGTSLMSSSFETRATIFSVCTCRFPWINGRKGCTVQYLEKKRGMKFILSCKKRLKHELFTIPWIRVVQTPHQLTKYSSLSQCSWVADTQHEHVAPVLNSRLEPILLTILLQTYVAKRFSQYSLASGLSFGVTVRVRVVKKMSVVLSMIMTNV